MNYEKRYKEALENASIAYKDEDRHLKATLERIFPELQKSEDEKIREELIDAIQGLWDNDALPMPLSVKRKNSWIAWLEKQREQEPISITDEWIEDYWQHEKVINFDSYDKGEEIQFDHYGFVNFCKKYCQKPIERSEEDEKVRKALIEYFNEQCDMSDWNGIYGYQVVAWLEKQGEQKTDDKTEPKFKPGDTMRTWREAANGYTDGMPVVVSIDNEYYHCTNELIAIKDQDNYEFPPINMKQKSSDKVESKFHEGDWL